ncbi:MAG: Multidrug resistance protein MdtB [Chlamydiales bacterium]|nr:Multidrug resistance protein MdtB [Chlamydiales bacterium]MCH9619883.1 Multidrug resistance protein MdtB [Chlamydiales bacterium]MCH9622690.1 Multidrug resistance protein MdtB [Chlamydiales bacterium]
MKSIVAYALSHRTVIYFFALLLLIGGVVSFGTLGQLEDPVFTVKKAVIITKYPGASPKEVELEVTDRIETALQELPQLKHLYSISRAGESIIEVDIKEQFWSDRLPQVWDEVRRKVNDVAPKLPPGAGKPLVGDDFGFVYGFLLALTGDGYSYGELEEYGKIVKKELSLVKDVSRVELWGVQPKVVYLDISESQLAALKLTAETISHTLQKQNMVVNSGFVDDDTNRFRIEPTGEFKSPEEIGELILRPSPNDMITNILNVSQEKPIDLEGFERALEAESTNVIQVKDIATVRPGYLDPPMTMMRFDGKPAIGIQIAGSDEANIVTVGGDLYERLSYLVEHLPIGLDLHKVAWQADLVDDAVNGFLWSLLLAVIIVLVVLIIPSGLRMGTIIGSNLFLTILGTFIYMSIYNIPLQRMSLGALIIALGMMVDNSIVVADAIAVKIRLGLDRKRAAIEGACSNAWPLLSATLIATFAFYPIFASSEDAGEYCRTLYIVVAVSLILSWIIAMLVTPLQCIDFLPEGKGSGEEEFQTPLFQFFRKVIGKLIRVRGLTMIVLIGLLVLSGVGFQFVRQLFFPDSTRPQLMIDYWGPEGGRIQDVSAVASVLEKEAMKQAGVESVTSFIGAGPPRFYLPVDPEKQYQSYAQLIINFENFKEVDSFIATFKPWVEETVTDGMVRFRKYGVGPGDAWKFELRISGPGEADLTTLRELGEQVMAIGERSEYGTDWRLDMRNPVLKVIPQFDQKRGRWSSVTREDLANATLRAYEGREVGLYREGDTLYPIVLRNIESEREDLLSSMDMLQIKPTESTKTVPLAQVANKVSTKWEDPLITRWDRRRAVAVQASPKLGATFPELKKSIKKEIEAVDLPPGYEFFWDGEEDSSTSAQKSLIPGIIPAIVLILFLLISVFNASRPVIIILLTIPFAIIGVTAGLLIFNIPFGFMALLGAMSLAGMMNKNIVVLLDAAALNVSQGMSRHRAITEAAVCRARPVLLAAGTTILGVIPLLPDVFWVSMAVTIMAGLAFGSLLTLIAVPVLYSIFYKDVSEK